MYQWHCEDCGDKLLSNGKYTTFDKAHPKERIVCWPCYSAISKARAKALSEVLVANNYLVAHLGRARKLGLPADLTLEEWNATKAYFHHRCAYCQTGPVEVLEHFIPLKLGGGTTKGNCVPACQACNHKKRGVHPTLVKCIPQADIKRVHEYLMSFL